MKEPTNGETETPISLNQQLRAILVGMPSQENLSGKRDKSEYLAKLFMKLDQLLRKSRITDSFKKFIVNRFQSYIDLGVDQDPYVSEEFFFLDLNDQSSLGIYDVNRAKELEKIGILKQMAENNRNARIRQVINEFTFSNQPHQTKNNQPNVDQWRLEFQQQYAEQL